MPYTIAHQNIAEFLNDALGDCLDDVTFADLTDEVVATIEAVADRLAEERPA
jgi:hypothetical protein